jgi:hypothetical protein
MWRIPIVLLTASAGLLSGCTFLHYGADNLVTVPVNKLDACKLHLDDRLLARQAWAEIAHENPEGGYSRAFQNGFIDGFADYLDRGGKGMPPAMPPWCYRLSCYQNPRGHEEIENWFAGYRRGVAAAQATGLRTFRVIPTSAPGLKQPYPAFHHGTSMDGSLPNQEVPELPAPSPVPTPHVSQNPDKDIHVIWRVRPPITPDPAAATSPAMVSCAADVVVEECEPPMPEAKALFDQMGGPHVSQDQDNGMEVIWRAQRSMFPGHGGTRSLVMAPRAATVDAEDCDPPFSAVEVPVDLMEVPLKNWIGFEAPADTASSQGSEVHHGG